MADAGRVAEAEAEPESTLGEPPFHQRHDSNELVLRCRAVESRVVRLAERKRALPDAAGDRTFHRPLASTLMADRRPVVEERSAITRCVPTFDGIDADLELQRCRHAVSSLIAIAGQVLSVGVQVDKTGRHHEPRRVQHLPCRQRGFGNGDDLAIADADVAWGVEAALRVHHAATGDDEIERSVGGCATASDDPDQYHIQNQAACSMSHRRYFTSAPTAQRPSRLRSSFSSPSSLAHRSSSTDANSSTTGTALPSCRRSTALIYVWQLPHSSIRTWGQKSVT